MNDSMNRFALGVIYILFNHSQCSSVRAIGKCSPESLQTHLQRMEEKQERTVEPCKDFYTYACGNWETTYHLRKLGARDTLTNVKAENKLLLIQYFKTFDDKSSKLQNSYLEISPTRKCLLNFYQSCANQHLTDERYAPIQTYANVLRKYSDWPILNPEFSETNANVSFNWEYVSAHMRRYGADSFWRTLVQPNWQNADKRIIYIVPPAFEFLQRSKHASGSISQQRDRARAKRHDEDEIFLYKTYVKYLLFDMNVRVRRALEVAQEIVDFELNLMALTADEQNSVVLKAPQTLDSLTMDFPHINFQKFFENLLQDLHLPWSSMRKMLIVVDSDYLEKLSDILKGTKAETIGKFLLIKFLTHFEVNLHDDELYGARQEHCLQQANTFLPKELSRLYLDLQHEGKGMEFLKKAQSDLSDMFGNLKFVFQSLINDTSVFDHNLQTRVDGLEKLHAMQLSLPDLRDFNEECGPIQDNSIGIDSYDVNFLQLSKVKVLQEFIALNKSFVYDLENSNVHSDFNNASIDYEMRRGNTPPFTNYGPLDVNAYYRLRKNAIEIPVGLLASPIYDNCLEAPMIYGTIAFIVGHELLHGFDYDGLNYDKTGNIADGWDPKSIIAYGTKASCYLGARYDSAHTNVNENIADSEGLRLALGALEKLKGPLQPEKLKWFFISFAQIWCRASNDHNERHTLHADHQERVNNVLGNFQAFAETFHCKSGSSMNPAEKCRIW